MLEGFLLFIMLFLISLNVQMFFLLKQRESIAQQPEKPEDLTSLKEVLEKRDRDSSLKVVRRSDEVLWQEEQARRG